MAAAVAGSVGTGRGQYGRRHPAGLGALLRGFKEILSGSMDEYPEAAFFNAGTIDDVIRKAEQMKKGGM